MSSSSVSAAASCFGFGSSAGRIVPAVSSASKFCPYPKAFVAAGLQARTPGSWPLFRQLGLCS